MRYAWQKTKQYPIWNNMPLEKEWLYLETLTSNIPGTGQILWYKNKKGSELKQDVWGDSRFFYFKTGTDK